MISLLASKKELSKETEFNSKPVVSNLDELLAAEKGLKMKMMRERRDIERSILSKTISWQDVI